MKIDYLLLQQKRIRLVRTLAIMEPLIYHPPLHSTIYFILCLFHIFILLSYVFLFCFTFLFYFQRYVTQSAVTVACVFRPISAGACQATRVHSVWKVGVWQRWPLYIPCSSFVSWTLDDWLVDLLKEFSPWDYIALWGKREGKETINRRKPPTPSPENRVSQGEIWTQSLHITMIQLLPLHYQATFNGP